MASIIYGLCALLSLAIAALLWRNWMRTRARLSYWSAWCFTGLTLNNVLLVVDKLLLPEMDLGFARLVTALLALALLLFGLVYADE